MDSAAMLTFPLPVMTAALCSALAVLVWRAELGCRRANLLFAAFFCLSAVSSLLVGLRFGYGLSPLIPLQRILPLYFGPLLYLGFAALLAEGRPFRRRAALHMAAPVAALALFWLLVADMRQLDWLISASYLGYAAALARLWRKGPDTLAQARLDRAGLLHRWMLRAAGLLVFVLFLDSAIAADFALFGGTHVPALISAGTVPLLVMLLAMLCVLPAVFAVPGRSPAAAAPAPAGAEAAGTEERLRQLLQKEQLFLDPELSVQRLARRLHIPARELSAAVNRTQGQNVSQYVNGFRLAHAAGLLESSSGSVTSIAASSGFLSRSNFYREFQRVYGETPAEYRRLRAAEGTGA
ncbi:AraC family transcriptional regulator [Leisingera sp. SS27]|uniref:helix-turn-helix domain-containing protein n=1 Tax=Leisingera sp. SS27 TaxID=2979462 RepID=UPI00232AE0CC|nr:AraC family transcriptional regulator [Leisingera sp. SS27]MDC0658167.1 AraC family transcriptional regulator [Leisingera sp. SS27]